MVIYSKKRIELSVNPCPKCGSNNSKIMTTQRKVMGFDHLPACVKCLDCGFTVGVARSKGSVVGMFYNPEFAVKAWNNRTV